MFIALAQAPILSGKWAHASYRCACGVLEAALVFETIVVFDIGVYFYIDKSIGSLAFVGGRRKYVYEIVSFHAFTVAIRFEFFSCTNY